MLWNRLFDTENPFVQHAFLLALEESGCVSPQKGWQAQHMMLMAEDRPLAVMPLYVKENSYGEFVFDWGWAEAYERHGLNYYPKLITAIPFSPVAGPRVGISPTVEPGEAFTALLNAIHQRSVSHHYSSWLESQYSTLSASVGYHKRGVARYQGH
jgi:predicted N-acyltransferase